MLEQKAARSRKPKVIFFMVAMVMMLSMVVSAAAAPLEAQPHAALATEDHSLIQTSENLSAQEMLIMHYNWRDNPTGWLHSITIDQYYAILDALMTAGYPASPHNIDCMNHRMRGGDCDLNPL